MDRSLQGTRRAGGSRPGGGIYAFEHNVERLAEDHANAQFLADGLATVPGVKLVYDTTPTNIVFFDISETGITPSKLEAGMLERGVRMGGGYDGSRVVRAVTHLDVSREDCATAVEVIREVCASA